MRRLALLEAAADAARAAAAAAGDGPGAAAERAAALLDALHALLRSTAAQGTPGGARRLPAASGARPAESNNTCGRHTASASAELS